MYYLLLTSMQLDICTTHINVIRLTINTCILIIVLICCSLIGGMNVKRVHPQEPCY